MEYIALTLQVRQDLLEEDVCCIPYTMLEMQLMHPEVSVDQKIGVSLLVTSSIEGMRWSQSTSPSKIKCCFGQ